MTTVNKIITDAYRQSNLISVGTVPSADQYQEALAYLNRLVKSVLGNEVGEQLESFPIGRHNIERPQGFPYYNPTPDGPYWFVPKNKNLICNLEESVTVFLDPMPNDGSRLGAIDASGNFATYNLTIKANGRNIENSDTLVLNQDGANQEWFYRADLGNWQKCHPLVGTDTFPFPEDFDDVFVTMLAIRINPSYQVAADEQVISAMNRGRSQIRARYAQHIQVRSEDGLIAYPKVAFGRYWYWPSYGTPQDIFNIGYYPW